MNYKSPAPSSYDPLQEATNSHMTGQSFTSMLDDVTKPQQYGSTQQKHDEKMTYKNGSELNQTSDVQTDNYVSLFRVNISV